jgi:hypothetical protein
VAEYDAFGRKIGEDTLEGLGSTSEGQSRPAWPEEPAARPEPAPAPERIFEPEPVTPSPDAVRPKPAAAPSDTASRQQLAAQLGAALSQAAAARATTGLPTARRSAGRGCLIAGVVVLVLIGAAIIGVVALVGTVSDVVDESIEQAKPTRPVVVPKGLGVRSLVRPARFADALRDLRSQEAGRLTNLRLAPERIDVQLLTSAGRLRSLQLKPGGKWERFGSDSGAGFDSVGTIPFARLNPAAPARLARRGARKIGVPVTDLQYLVPTLTGGRVTWGAYFSRSRYVLGDSAGRFQRKYP